MVGLIATFRRAFAKGDLHGLLLPVPPSCGEPLLTHGRPSNTSRQLWCSLLWGCCSFPLGLIALQHWSLCFPRSCGSPVIKPRWPSGTDSMRIPVPRLHSQAGKPDLGFRAFMLASLVSVFSSCGSPTGGRGTRFYCGCTPPGISLQLLLCLWPWSVSGLVGSRALLSVAVQRQAVTVGLPQAGVSACIPAAVLNWDLLIQHSVSVAQLFRFCLLTLVLTEPHNRLEICELIVNCPLPNFLCKIFAQYRQFYSPIKLVT